MHFYVILVLSMVFHWMNACSMIGAKKTAKDLGMFKQQARGTFIKGRLEAIRGMYIGSFRIGFCCRSIS